MLSEVAVHEHYDTMNRVVEYSLKGYNETSIAKMLKMKRPEVVGMLEEWRKNIAGHHHIQERGRDALAGADTHFQMVINELWQTVDQAQDAKTRASILTSIANTESQRMGILMKAGVLDTEDIARQIAETEKKHEALMAILRDVASECPVCRSKILSRISDLANKAEAVVVVGDVVKA